MSRRTRMLVYAVAAVCFLAAPGPLSAQAGGGTSALVLSLGDVCQMVGGTAALGFELWNFTVDVFQQHLALVDPADWSTAFGFGRGMARAASGSPAGVCQASR